MKLRILISLLFFVATTFTALHELEHIKAEHGSSTCLVCTISHNLVSADTPKSDISCELTYTKKIISNSYIFVFNLLKTDNYANAPPFKS
ncbi:MAG: hypothetical protein OQJ77_02480 [Thiovulaceae bacterium]|nr:hypothetical protein [Sulfurimonadaceae bacterium]MCW9026159.1 hypothetical protein [Sulfurimonadaceae bacterium]